MIGHPLKASHVDADVGSCTPGYGDCASDAMVLMLCSLVSMVHDGAGT